jgi:hypothetical protein
VQLRLDRMFAGKPMRHLGSRVHRLHLDACQLRNPPEIEFGRRRPIAPVEAPFRAGVRIPKS